MTWKVVRELEDRCLFVMHLHVKGRFPVKKLANLILFTQPSAVSVTAPKWIDSRARLQFQFFLNLFSCLPITNLPRRNDTLTFEGTATDSESPLHSRCHQRCSRDRMQMTYFSFYDHDATQSECAHRLRWMVCHNGSTKQICFKHSREVTDWYK